LSLLVYNVHNVHNFFLALADPASPLV